MEPWLYEIAEELRELSTEVALVIVEQRLELALGIADYAYVLDSDRVTLEGFSVAVRNDPTLLQFLAP